MKIRSFVAWLGKDGTQGGGRTIGAAFAGPEWSSWTAGALQFRFVPRLVAGAAAGVTPRTLLLGDDAEWEGAEPGRNLASGVPIRPDATTRRLTISTSIVALPPVFLYRDGQTVAVASDIHLLRLVPGVRLTLDPGGVVELGHFGHPVANRTLFTNVELVPAGSRLVMGQDVPGTASYARVWEMPRRERLSGSDFVEAQISAFLAHVRRLDLERSFLSLTAGLDTRTVFSALAHERHLVPGATMTGPRRSLDARVARQLCDAYGVRHMPLVFDDRFTDQLPRLLQTASHLSGGLASVEQAPEVFMYDQLGDAYQARLSGNLGNQVGRGGTEGISVRAARLDVLSPALRGSGAPVGHWLLQHLSSDEHATHDFIFRSEIPFTLLPNFSVGNHFATQQSPYASRDLIETLAQRPAAAPRGPTGSKVRMRLRDLKHRFLGEPEAQSFQRTLIHRNGGFAARCPVNWGWRPSGGVSASGLLMGAATLAGMFARATGLDDGVLRRPMAWTGLPALHDFRESRRWLREDLRDFTMDTLRSDSVRQAGVFDTGALDRLLDEHFVTGKDHYQTVTFALDVALAHQTFTA